MKRRQRLEEQFRCFDEVVPRTLWRIMTEDDARTVLKSGLPNWRSSTR